MGRNPVFNVERKKSEFLRLFALGNNVTQCALLVGVSMPTYRRWLKKDFGFELSFNKIKEGKAHQLLNDSLESLASWHEEEVIETESISVDDEGRPQKVKRKITKKPPQVPALKMLANKYDKEYNEKVYNDREGTNINIRITQQDRSLSLEERLALLEKDASGVVECNDYRELDSNEVESKEVVNKRVYNDRVVPPVEDFG